MKNTQIQKGRFENRTTFLIALVIMVFIIFMDIHVLSQTTGENYWFYSENQPSDDFTDVLMISPTDVYFTGITGTIYHSTNYTNTFTSIFSASSPLNTIDGNDTFLIAAGDAGYVTKSTDGETWIELDLGQAYSESFKDIEIQGDNIWLIGTNGLILYSNNSGISFVKQNSVRAEQLNSIDFMNASTGFIVGDNGLIMKTSNYGSSWITIDSKTTLNLNSINLELSSSPRIWIGGDQGLFLASYGATFGETFLVIDTGITENINDVYSPIFGIVWVVGDSSTILGLRGNEFKNIQLLETNATINFNAVYAINNEAIAVGGEIYFNKEGLVPVFSTDVDWSDWWFFVSEVEPLLLKGMVAAVKVIVVAIVVGFMIGLFMATLRTIRNRPLNIIATAYSDLFRNTPLLVQLFFITFGLPELGVNPPLFMDAVIALSLNTGAYQSEIIRSGIQAIPKGQMEAARSLGMTNVQAMKEIILPQAVRLTIPPLSNEAVILFLNSSLLSVIAYEEITRVGTIVANATFLYSKTFILVALTYFIVTYSITQILRSVERKLKIPGLGGGAL